MKTCASCAGWIGCLRAYAFILMGLGVLLLIAGIAYGVVFAGVPYQDPTPEMSARYEFHDRIASGICLLGGGAFLGGVFGGVLRVICGGASRQKE